jgi:hypothetical protein
MEVLLADAMFGKNRMTEAGYDVDGNGVIEENELVDLQRLNYSTPGGMRRGEMQVPAGGFSRYAQSMCNKAKAERVRREQRERELLGSPHCPKGTMVRVATGELVPLGSWRGSDLVSGLGSLQPLIKENGATPTRVFASKKSDGKLKNHETKDRALVTSNVALPKKQTPPSGTANKRSPLSGSHSSDAFDDAHDAFTKDEHFERARLHAQTGRPAPKVAPTPETEERHQAALALTSRSAPSFAQLLISFFGAGDESLPRVSSSDKAAMVATEVQKANYKASAEKLLPEGYNGSYNAVVQQTNAQRAEETRQDEAHWKEELQTEEQKYMDKAIAARTAVQSGKSNAEMAKEEIVRAKQMEAEEIVKESKRLMYLAHADQVAVLKANKTRTAVSFDNRYLTIDEMVATLQKFSPEEASLTPRSQYSLDPQSRNPTAAYLIPFKGQSDKVTKENAALFTRIHNIGAKTDDDVDDEAAGAARATMAAESEKRKKDQAKKLAAQNVAIKKKIAATKAKVDADYDETPLNKND